MKKLYNTIILLISASVIISSCKKDEPANPNISAGKKCYPTIIKQDNRVVTEYTYTADNRLDILKENDSSNGDPATYKMIYDANGRIIKAVDIRSTPMDSTYHLLTYNADNTVKKSEYIMKYGNEKSLVQTYDFEYNALKQISKAKIISPFFGPEPYAFLEMLYDAKGNMTMMKFYMMEGSTQELIGTFMNEFDDKKNPLNGIQTPPIDFEKLPTGPNNVLKSTTSFDGEQDIIQFNYTYNADGYPEMAKYIDADSKSRETEYIYTCK